MESVVQISAEMLRRDTWVTSGIDKAAAPKGPWGRGIDHLGKNHLPVVLDDHTLGRAIAVGISEDAGIGAGFVELEIASYAQAEVGRPDVRRDATSGRVLQQGEAPRRPIRHSKPLVRDIFGPSAVRGEH
jgi:hypothetical protein